MHNQFFKEEQLESKFESEISPFWETQVQHDTFSGTADISIKVAYYLQSDPKGNIVISSGRSEGMLKYQELFFDLVNHGYSVFILDHRGQGESGRMADNPDKGHVADFQDYVADLNTFIKEWVLPRSGVKPHLLCHSMGCAIGANYLIKHPSDIDKVVFGSPMFGLDLPLPDWMVNGILATSKWINDQFSNQPWYFLGQGNSKVLPFKDNYVTHSQVRYDVTNKAMDKKNVQLGGITTQWLIAANKGMRNLQDRASQIIQPMLILQAQEEKVVSNKAQNLFCDNAQNCKLLPIEKAYHEIFLEKDNPRTKAMNALLEFFEE